MPIQVESTDNSQSNPIVTSDSNIPFRHYQPREGDADFNECYKEAMELVEKIKPIILKTSDLTATQKLNTIKRKMKGYQSAIQNYLINRRRFKNLNHNFRPLYVIWTTLNDCNFACTYCDNHQGKLYPDIPDPDRLDTEQGKKLLKIMRTGTPTIYWCGGEPTLRKDLPKLLDYACSIGYFPNIINTNGSILHQRLQKADWSKFLYQMDIIIISIDGMNLDRLKDLWKFKNPKQVFVNVLLMKELQNYVDFKLCVNNVIIPGAVAESKAAFNLACDLDIWYVPVPVNYKHSPNQNLLNDPEYKELANLILERKKQGYKIIGSYKLLKKLLFAEDYKCLTTLKPHVWSNGNIAYPCRASHTIPPADINILDYNTFDEVYAAGGRLINPDNFHGQAVNQCGGQCAWMQNYTTDRYADGFKSLIRGGFIHEVMEFVAKSK